MNQLNRFPDVSSKRQQLIKLLSGRVAKQLLAVIVAVFSLLTARADITTGLVVDLTLDDTTGQVAHDAGANHLDGSLVNFPTDDTEWQPGLIAGALHFNNASVQYVTNSGPALNAVITNKVFTLAAWVQASSLASGTTIVAKGTGGGHESFVIDCNVNHWRFFVRNATGAATQLNPATPLTNGNWTHLVAVFNQPGGIMQIYVNGILAASGAPPTTLWADAHEMSIGNRQSGTAAYNEPAFGGLIDDVRVYSRALTAGDISELYNYGNHAYSPVGFSSTPPSGTRYIGDTFIFPAQTVYPVNPLYPLASTSYQWYFVDSTSVTNAIANATNSSLTLANLQLTNSGTYFLQASNSAGVTNSASALLTVSPLPTPDITTGLTEHLAFDETGGMTAADSSGNGNTGTLIGLPGDNTTWVPGIINNGLLSVGANEYVSVADSPGLNFGANTPVAFTLSAWVKSSLNATGAGSQVDGAGILAKGYGGGQEIFAFDVHLGNYRFYVRSANNGAATQAITSTPCLSNIWEHIVATFDNSNQIMNVYVNGQLSLAIIPPATLNTNTHALTIGAREGGPATGFNLPFIGIIDDVRIYNRALNSADIQALYALGGVFPPTVSVQPQGSTNYVGDTVVFTAGINGTAPISYQWQLNNTNLPGQTNSILTLANVQLTNTGAYTLFASNAYGTTFTSNAVLQVNEFAFSNTVAYWAFDDGSGNTALDSSGNGNNGNLNNYPGTDQWINGRIGGGLSFNTDGSTSEYVEVPDAPSLNFNQTKAFTIAAWVRSSGTQPNGAGIVAKGGASASVQYALDVFNGAYRFFVRNSTGGAILAASAIAPTGRWQHLVASLDGNTGAMSLYVNGVLAATGAGATSLQANASPLSIGSRYSASAGYDLPFVGVIDDVRLYNKALSAAQAAQLYAQAAPLAPMIYLQPIGGTRYFGDSQTFSVVADGTNPLSYQWQKDGVNLTNATSSTLTLNNVQAANAGTYRLKLTDANASVFSSNAVLQVIPYPAPDLTTALIAYWNFDETNGTSAADSSGNGNSATLNNFPGDNSMWVPGVVGGALQFNADGTGQNFVFTDGPVSLQNGNQFTFSFWAKQNPGPIGANPRFITPATGPGSQGWVQWDRGSGVGLSPAAASTQPTTDAWHHFAVTFDRLAGTYSLYVDGRLQVANAGGYSLPDPTYPSALFWTIGHSENIASASDSWTGLLDEVRIYNRIMNLNDVKALYYAGAKPQLGVAATGSTLTLSWPAAAAGYHLQSTSALSTGNSWADVATASAVSADGLNQTVTESIAPGASKFYRLKNP